jgi:hypothetical protein
MHDQILHFLTALDEELARHAKPGAVLDLYLLGRGSLILRLDLTAVTTDDLDIVWMSTSADRNELEERAIELFGQGT